jgi:hypothetical protein
MQAMQGVLDDHECAKANFIDIDLGDADGPWSLVEGAIRSSGDSGHGNPVPGLKAVAVTKILHESDLIWCQSLTLRFTASIWARRRPPELTARRQGGFGRCSKPTCALAEPGSPASRPRFKFLVLFGWLRLGTSSGGRRLCRSAPALLYPAVMAFR